MKKDQERSKEDIKGCEILWIDDEWESRNKAFITQCYMSKGFKVTPFKTVRDGIEELKTDKTKYDAIILDAYCLVQSEEDALSDQAVYDALDEIKKLPHVQDLPVFVYSGQAGLNDSKNFKTGLKRLYEIEVYVKGEDEKKLLDDLEKAIQEGEAYLLKKKYQDVLCFDEINDTVFELLLKLKGKKQIEKSDFNKMRDCLEYIRQYAYDTKHKKIFKDEVQSLNQFSQIISKTSGIPEYIKRSFHSLTVISNIMSHKETENQYGEIHLDQEYFERGGSPYVFQSTLYELLNIIHWMGSDFCRLMTQKEQNEWLMKLKNILQEKYHWKDERVNKYIEKMVEMKDWWVLPHSTPLEAAKELNN